ncbi:ROK family protein [Fredinandcohnia sp. 179-A 10B2 NHS]|uniref:ROK family protein n=1 Tax=Fredinandcohnia sp. 179-A 10B2 NHS TaxID=3235176 RepID=UPI0039A2089F
MRQFLAFDIGGTHIKYGIVDETGKILSKGLLDTEAYLGGMAIINKLIAVSKDITMTHTIDAIAISTAGQVDSSTGTIVGAGETIPNYTGLEVKALVSKALNLPVEVRNDVECAALGEMWLGNHDSSNLFVLTIGTGIGGAIVIDNKIYSGHTCKAGECGYMLVEGEPFEKNASITGLIRYVQRNKEYRSWTGKEIFKRYDQGDETCKVAVAHFYKHLAIGIANLVYIFNPEKVIIGGALTGRGELFLEEVKLEVQKYLQPGFYSDTEIVLAKLGNNAGMIGAVYHFLERNN